MEFGRGMHRVEINGEPIYLKKSKVPIVGGWTVISPYKNEMGKINWFNLITGGKKNFLSVLLFVLIVCFLWYSFNDMRGQMAEVVANPCLYCPSLKNPYNISKAPMFNINTSSLDNDLKNIGGDNNA